MTETRKAIINILSDYMDKTLIEWCFINVHWEYLVLKQDNSLFLFYYNSKTAKIKISDHGTRGLFYGIVLVNDLEFECSYGFFIG